MVKHYVRKHMYCNPFYNGYYGYPDKKKIAFYDVHGACGVNTILGGTHIKKNVTCKNCKRTIMFRKKK